MPKDIYRVAEWSLRSGVYSRTVGKRRGFVVLFGRNWERSHPYSVNS